MKVRLPTLFQDSKLSMLRGGSTVALRRDLEDEFFLDGPVSRRLAVVDFNADGTLHPGAKLSPADGDKRRTYLIDPSDFQEPEYRAVLVFGSVWKTIDMFEDENILGSRRKLAWAFGAPQLLIVPRAGEWPNAFYERESHSLQFFYFETDRGTLNTCLSADIVAHETGHAVLDAICPDLYDATSPQSLAIHESIADLTAICRALDNRPLVDEIGSRPEWTIRESSQFTALAEEFGNAISLGRRSYLRNAYNNKTLCDDAPKEDQVARDEPHALSEVLTGALYRAFVAQYEKFYDKYMADEDDREKAQKAARGKALGIARDRFSRIVFRALDYVPPGEVSFADLGRAIVAADMAAYPSDDDNADRQVIIDEFVRRCIVATADELMVPTLYELESLSNPEADFDAIRDSEWHAQQFVNDNRNVFGIPSGVAFELRDRLDVSKVFPYTKRKNGRELVIKISWEEDEPNPIGGGFPERRLITKGATLVIDWDLRLVRALLQTNNDEQQRQDRDDYLRNLVDRELLVVGNARSFDGSPRQGAIAGKIRQDRMQVGSTCRSLHLIGNDEDQEDER